MFRLCMPMTFAAVIFLGCGSLVMAQKPPFLVLEAFRTSDCPPCDEVETALRGLSQQDDTMNLPTYVLIFHTDPNQPGDYTRPEFTNRLNAYSQMLKNQQVAFPLIVANGETKIANGLDSKALTQARKTASRLAPGATIDLEARKTGVQDITVQYEITPELRGNLLQVTLIQKQEKGASEIAEMSHVQIVRDFKSMRFRGDVTTGNVTLKIPDGVESSNLQIVAFSQNQISGQIVAATACEIEG